MNLPFDDYQKRKQNMLAQNRAPSYQTTSGGGLGDTPAPSSNPDSVIGKQVNVALSGAFNPGQDQSTTLGFPRVQGAPPEQSAPPGQGGTNFFSPDNLNQGLMNLGFGQKPTQITPPTIGATPMPTAGHASASSVAAPPMVNAPQITAEQGGFKDFDALQKSLYQSQFDPTARELGRQKGLADEQLKARLAQAGISDSGAGISLEQRQNEEYDRQVVSASQDAATKAAAQRYGMEYTQSMDNARMRQEANLANAGFKLQAQVENARNLLTANVASAQLATQASVANAQMATQASIAGSQLASNQAIAQAQMQLQAMGLNVQSEQNARQSFLQLMDIQERDLQRLDDFNLNNFSLFFNSFLKQLAIIGQIGTGSFSKGDASSDSTNIGGNVAF